MLFVVLIESVLLFVPGSGLGFGLGCVGLLAKWFRV